MHGTCMMTVFSPCSRSHRKVIFRLPLSNKCVQSLLRFRLGCHNLPRDVGTRTAIPRSQRFCPVLHGHGRKKPTRPFDTRVGHCFLRDSRPQGWQSTDLGQGSS